MKINKSHFITQQHAAVYQQALSNTAFLNDHHYGLMPMIAGVNLPKIWLRLDNLQYVNIRIDSCSAITRGGYLIHFQSNESDNQLSARIPGLSLPFSELKGKHEYYFVVLAVDPYNTVPCGAAHPEEQPIRLPYTQPSYSVSLMPEMETNINTLGEFQLPIGKIRVEEQSVSLVEDYLPPCTNVNSHPLMMQHQAETEQFFGRMELNTLQILQKILQKNQQNELIEPIRKLSEQVLFYISTVYENYKQLGCYAEPIQLITPVAGLARTIQNAIDIYQGTSKEEMVNYFTEWCNVKQGELEEETTALCQYKYDHLNIHVGIEMNVKFSALILQLFTNLAALDYIGKKKETGIFVKEKLVVPEQEVIAKKRGFFLAD